MRGHLWTVGPALGALLRPPSPAPARHFRTTVTDPRMGPVTLWGRLAPAPDARALLLVLHGLGGSSASPYAVRAARQAAAAGLASLRLDLRGADGRGEDLYHAALTTDLHAALASADLAAYGRVYVLGFSMGGHLALRLGTEALDPRVRAVAAVCPPLDLARSAAAIDRRRRAPYRAHLLRGLRSSYAAIAARGRPVPIPVAEALRITTFGAWDERVVAPRHGFASAHDYWARASVGPRLGALRVPSLMVYAERDPMVLADTVRPALRALARGARAGRAARGVAGGPPIATRWVRRGGHVGFPSDLHLGEDAPPGLERQVLAWLLRHG